MGYFRHPVRRGKASAAARVLVAGGRDVDVSRWRRCDCRLEVSRDVYLRFVVERPQGWTGLFTAGVLRDSEDFSPAARSNLRAVYRWFNANLPVPRRLPRCAVCWFRADASESIDRLRELIELYRLAGFPVRMRATASPGRIVYRDEFQVAAVPYADRRVAGGAA
jgi:hypothetical protein